MEGEREKERQEDVCTARGSAPQSSTCATGPQVRFAPSAFASSPKHFPSFVPSLSMTRDSFVAEDQQRSLYSGMRSTSPDTFHCVHRLSKRIIVVRPFRCVCVPCFAGYPPLHLDVMSCTLQDLARMAAGDTRRDLGCHLHERRCMRFRRNKSGS